MNILCVICSDVLAPSDEVFHTQCGHVFHFVCLGRWLERSSTCPQCRERTTVNNIHRIYLNFANPIITDSTFLQSKIDSLTFELTLKNQIISNLTETKDVLQKETTGLKQEVKRIEMEISNKNSAIHALKDQIQFYKQLCADAESKQKQLELLKRDIEKLKNTQALIDASAEEVDTMRTTGYVYDPSTLMTYISVMKREIADSFNKRRELRSKIRSLQEELMKATSQCNALSEERIKRKELEEILMNQESERVNLNAKLLDMHIALYNCVCSEVPAEKRKCPEECKEHNFEKESNAIISECISNLDQTLGIEESNNCIVINPTSKENTPQNIKSQGFFSIKNHAMKRNNSAKVPSILVKKSKFNQLYQKTIGNSTTFDGFGGHAKYDKFPKPLRNLHVKKIREEVKGKRQKLDIGDNQKLKDLLQS